MRKSVYWLSIIGRSNIFHTVCTFIYNDCDRLLNVGADGANVLKNIFDSDMDNRYTNVPSSLGGGKQGEITKNGEKFSRKWLFNIMIKYVAPVLLFVLFLQSVGILRLK